MEEFNFHYQQLPTFIQSELVWYVGSHDGLSLVQIIARHLAAADYWISKKSTGFQPKPNLDDEYGGRLLDRHEMDELKAIVHSQMDNLTTNAIVAS